MLATYPFLPWQRKQQLACLANTCISDCTVPHSASSCLYRGEKNSTEPMGFMQGGIYLANAGRITAGS